jgi:hypothetical protein
MLKRDVFSCVLSGFEKHSLAKYDVCEHVVWHAIVRTHIIGQDFGAPPGSSSGMGGKHAQLQDHLGLQIKCTAAVSKLPSGLASISSCTKWVLFVLGFLTCTQDKGDGDMASGAKHGGAKAKDTPEPDYLCQARCKMHGLGLPY